MCQIYRQITRKGVRIEKLELRMNNVQQINYRFITHLSLCMGKPTICISENKAADQLRGDREADQRLCFRYTDSTVSLLLKSEISSF